MIEYLLVPRALPLLLQSCNEIKNPIWDKISLQVWVDSINHVVLPNSGC